ncbi:hypothetical protein N0V90_010141 [Kalmusia sp. IMI 367209]|nr:hypothetical protein N0V90_010141 [Kalmusia sp. IMI 367209]
MQAAVSVGPELEEIQPEIIGFSSLSHGLEGPKKLKLLPSPWPSENAPPASATLLSVAPRRGLLAAASPDKLILASTENVRKAFQQQPGDNDVVTNFSPDATISVPQLRHVAFSSDEDFLVISAESGGGLAVYGVDDLLKGNTQPGNQISTNAPVRALLPNPAHGQYMAAVLDSGRLDIIDIASGATQAVRNSGVACVSWSLKGKAFVAGFNDGTAAVYLVGQYEQEKGRVPRPPEEAEDYTCEYFEYISPTKELTRTVSGVYWLNNEELFLIHSPPDTSEDALYHFVSTNKNYDSFTFRKTPYPLLFPAMDAPQRNSPPRFSLQRLRKWEPYLNEMLVLTAADSADVAVITHSTESIDPKVSATNQFQSAGLEDSRKATVPRNLADDGDSTLIGEALDLSSKEKVSQPSRRLEEITESPTPLPAYYLLTHEGLLAAYWVVWDKSLEAGTPYHGLTHADSQPVSTTPAKPASQEPKPSSIFGQTTPAAAAPPFGNGQPKFGSPSGPAFGTTSFPNTAATTSQPGKSLFGAATPINKQSPWGSTSQTPSTQAPNPFAAAAGASGFAKFGGGTPGGSAFSSFSSNKDGQSGFGALGQQKSAFAGAANPFGGLQSEKSFASTVTVDSKLTGTGSTLQSWANTPSQQGASIFGKAGNSSFASSSFASTQSGSSGADDAQNRQRDEATPTPQFPPQAKGLFGEKFTLGTTFKPDGSVKDDAPTPEASSGGSLFGNGFSSALGGTVSKPPATPTKPEPNAGSQNVSTTPATVPRPANSLFSNSNTREGSSTPKAVPTKEPLPDDAPLPPDFITSKPSKTDDDIPPLAGSPAVKIEAPSSSVPSSPLDDEDDGDLSEEEGDEGDDEGDDISVEEQDGDEETEEPSPSDAIRKARAGNWSFQDSVNQSPRVFPAAPTPPPTGRISALNQQTAGPTQSTAPAGFPKSPLSFPPQQQFRSISPVRAASTSVIGGTRREPLSASIQQHQSKPPTPQPQFSDLIDDEDERIRQELASDIEPSRILDPFIARQEYTEAALGKTGHAAQIEIVYRDINSMVDTLGLNSRSLKSFVEYHERPQRYTELTRSALEEVVEDGVDGDWFEKWSLAEVDDLKRLEDELEQELEEGRTKNILEKLSRLARLIVETSKLSSKVNEERRRIINSKDPEKLEALRKASLPKELADQQKALRSDYAQLLTLLGKGEDALVLLRSKLVSHSAKNGNIEAVPSVEAIKKTINKLIQITERKNNEITLLESKFRKVGLGESSRPSSSSSRQAATPLRRSRAAPRNESPFATPPTNRSRMSLMELNRVALTPEPETPSKGYGLYYTPEGSPSKNLSGVADMVDNELDRLRETAKRRRNIAESLASALADRGVKKTTVAA